MNILVKMPSRSRPEQLIRNIEEYFNRASDKNNIHFLISLDEDDESKEVFYKWKQSILLYWKELPCLIVYERNSKSKIDACNRDLDVLKHTFYGDKWDIVILASDDMRVQVDGWDEIIRDEMRKKFPDTDGCLWFSDGAKHSENVKQMICTLSIIGRKYYDRDGYIYFPGYKSFFCDNEFTEVAQRRGKIVFIDKVIIRHEHPNWGYGKTDALYERNNGPWNHDQQLYHNRLANGFK